MARDRIAQVYLGQVGGDETQKIARSRINWLCEQAVGTRVLDIGCSEGILAILLARKAIEVVGIDVNSDAIALAERLVADEPGAVQRRVAFILGDALEIDLSEHSFDTVVLGEVIEHLTDPRRMVQRAVSFLRPNGRLLLTTPFGVFPDPGHCQTFTLTSLAGLLRPFVVPDCLAVVDDYIRFVGRQHNDPAPLWAAVVSADNLLRITEAAVIDLQRTYRRRLNEVQQKRQELIKSQQQRRALSRKSEAKLKTTKPGITQLEDSLGDSRSTPELIRSDVGELKLLGGEFRSLLQLQEDLQSRLRDSQQRNQAKDKQLKAAEQRIARLESSLEEVYRTARYRIGDVMVLAAKPPIHTLKLPVRLWRIYWDKTKQHAQEAANRAHSASATASVRKRLRAFDRDFEKFVQLLKKKNYPYFVVMFSGTTYIQDIRANRPIRLTRSLLKMDVPVLFSFHRWRDAEHIPPYDTPTLFQSPIDLTPKLLSRLASADLDDTLRILIVSYPYPTVPRFLNRMNANGWVTLYDCRDDWEEFERVGAAKWYSPVVERYVVNNCDFTCCVSRVLQQKIQSMTTTREVRLSPNAYDEAFLKPGYVHRPGNTVKIGYFGHLSTKWFDWDSLIEIARQRPNYQFEIIGHSAPDDLPLPSNVALFGPKTHAQICDIASTWHVGIIPFKVGRLADSVDPIKIYEYFALQLPVVSFRIPQISDYPYTAMIETIDQFVAALDNAVQTKGDPATFKRFLQLNTWNIRAKGFLDLANEALALRQCEKTFQVDHSAKVAS